MWIEIPKKCEDIDCKENATHFFYRKLLFSEKWGFYCKKHANQEDIKYRGAI